MFGARAVSATTFVVCLLVAPAAFLSVAWAQAVHAPSGTYSIDPSHTQVIWHVDHMGFSSYAGRFNTIDGTLEFDAETPENSMLTVRIEATSVDVPNAKLQGELVTTPFFNASDFPEITFTSTAITRTDEGTGTVTGDLSLLGVTLPVTLDVTFNGAGPHPFGGFPMLGFSATGNLDRTQWGMDHLAPQIVGAEVSLRIDAEFHQR